MSITEEIKKIKPFVDGKGVIFVQQKAFLMVVSANVTLS